MVEELKAVLVWSRSVIDSKQTLKKPDGSLTFSGEEKAKLLSDHFDSKMSREEVDIP